MPRLSIVIPCLGGAADFDGTLVSVLQHRPAGSEIIVVHTEPYDDPYALGNEVEFIQATGCGLIPLINAAIDRARGEILQIVGCGLELIEGCAEAGLSHFDDPDVAAVSPLILRPDRSTIVAAGVFWSLGGSRRVVADQRLLLPGTARLRSKILGPTLAAAFYRRDILAALDGFDPSIGDRLADVEMALAIQQLGRSRRCDPASQLIQVADPGRNIPRSEFVDGRSAELLFWRHAGECGLAASLALHPFAVVADLMSHAPTGLALASTVGRASAATQIGGLWRHSKRLAIAAERLAEVAQLRAHVRMSAKPRLRQVAGAQSECRRAA